MFFKSSSNSKAISPTATCPGISCSYTCKVESTDGKTSEKVAADENKASVKSPGASVPT